MIRSGFSSTYNGDRPSGYFFITLTAPGHELLPWDREKCGHQPGECSGSAGCVCERFTVARWNETAPQRWSWFITDLRRVLKRDVQFAGSWETQKRGALHRHFASCAVGVSERRMRAAVRLCASRWGFGRQIDVQPINGLDREEIAMKAGYIAKYATKGGDLAVSLDVETGEIEQGGYRRWSASRRWGTTMAAVRSERQVWMANAASPAGPDRSGEVRAEPRAAEPPLDSEQEIYATCALLRQILGACEV